MNDTHNLKQKGKILQKESKLYFIMRNMTSHSVSPFIKKTQRKTQSANLPVLLVPVITQPPPIPILSRCRADPRPQLNTGRILRSPVCNYSTVGTLWVV